MATRLGGTFLVILGKYCVMVYATMQMVAAHAASAPLIQPPSSKTPKPPLSRRCPSPWSSSSCGRLKSVS